MDPRIQRDTATSGTLVFRENPDADVPGCNADDEGENDRGLTTTDTKPDRSTRHSLSDRVPANTDQALDRLVVPILPIGMKAKGLVGNPPPRTVIGIPSQAYERGRNCRGTLSVLQSLCRTQNDAVRYNALPHEPPQSDQ